MKLQNQVLAFLLGKEKIVGKKLKFLKFKKAQKKYKRLKIKFFNKFDSIRKILRKKKIHYSMISVSGLDGLKPSIILCKYSNNLAIVNKELSLIHI